MSEPVDLIQHQPQVLADAREILAKMTPAERAEAEAEARAKGVMVEVLVVQTIGTLVRGYDMQRIKYAGVRREAAKLPYVGIDRPATRRSPRPKAPKS